MTDDGRLITLAHIEPKAQVSKQHVIIFVIMVTMQYANHICNDIDQQSFS